MRWFKKAPEKKISLFAVVKRDKPTDFLTITPTSREAVEYAEKLLQLEHLSHYEAWCKLRDLSADDDATWVTYCSQCISKEEKNEYLISKIYYKVKDLAAIMRMFDGCVPLGCSFDNAIEINYAKAKESISKFEKDFEAAWAEEQQKQKETQNGSK